MSSLTHSNDAGISHLLLLPGLMCDHSFWQPLLESRPANLRCVVADYGDASSLRAMAEAALQSAPERFALAGEWIKGMVHPARLTDAALLGQVLDMFERKSAERFAQQQQALLSRPDATGVLAQLASWGIPSMLLCGWQDSWASVAQHQAMQALALLSELCVIEDAGHMVLMERPEATIAAMLSLVQKKSGAN